MLHVTRGNFCYNLERSVGYIAMLPQLAMQLPREVMISPKSCHTEIVNMASILLCKWMKNERNRIRNVGSVNSGPCAQFPCDPFLGNMVLCQELRCECVFFPWTSRVLKND